MNEKTKLSNFLTTDQIRELDNMIQITFMNINRMIMDNLIDNYENYIDPKDPTNNCLDVAIITAPEKRSKKTIEKLNTVAGRVLNK